MTDEPKPPELPPEYDPSEYRIAKNGAIMSRETGRIVTGQHVTNKITEGIAAEYHAIREKNKLSGLLATNTRLAQEAGSSDAAWADVAGSMFKTATSEKGSIASVQSAKLLGVMAGYLDGAGNGQDRQPATGIRVTGEIGIEDVTKLISALADMRTSNQAEAHNEPPGPTGGEVVDGVLRDIEK